MSTPSNAPGPSGDEVWSVADHDFSSTEWFKLLRARVRPRWTNFSWASPATLLDSVNDQVAKAVDRDLVNMRRMRWVATARQARRAAGAPDPPLEWVMDRTDLEDFRFMVLGDPGEQDASQYAVVAPLIARAQPAGDREAAAFMVILSDVIYPAGDVNDYVDGFYRPYEKFPGPVYAVPGNHDWYDGLEGFMYHFCGAEPLGVEKHLASSLTLRERVAQLLWRQSARPERTWLYSHGVQRNTPPGRELPHAQIQPGPYYAIRTRHVTLVVIDTGINGTLDAEQGDWLQRVSGGIAGPKILLTGKPLVVNGEYHPCEIDRAYKAFGSGENAREEELEEKLELEGGAAVSVDEIVRDPVNQYVATFGGDIHNYQRYRLGQRVFKPGEDAPHPARARPFIDYVVAGGGGAYLACTHSISPVYLAQDGGPEPLPADVVPLDETTQPPGEPAFLCYPKRGDSLTLFTRLFGPLVAWVMLANTAAALVLASAFITGRPFGLGVLDDRIIKTANVWQVLVGGAGMVVIVTLIGSIAVWATRRAVWPYEGLTGFSVALTLGLATVGAIAVVFDDSWTWLWGVQAVTVGLLLLFAAMLLIARQMRGLGPTIVGDYAIAALLAAALVHAYWDRHGGTAAHAFLLGGAASVTAYAAALLRWARHRPVIGSVVRRFVALAILGGLITAAAVVLRHTWIPAVALVSFVAIFLEIVAAVIFMTWPGAIVWPWLFRRMDPGDAFAEVAARTGLPNERDCGRAASFTGRRQADLLMARDGRPRRASSFVSELTEAAKPPFFKQFLEIEVTERQLRTRCWGVCGDAGSQYLPSLEDDFTTPLTRDQRARP